MRDEYRHGFFLAYPRADFHPQCFQDLDDPDGARVLAVDNCSMEIAAGEFCVVVGPSGCGKTTLLNAMAGFHDITSGESILDGEGLCSPGKKASPGSDRIVVFQQPRAFPLVHGARKCDLRSCGARRGE